MHLHPVALWLIAVIVSPTLAAQGVCAIVSPNPTPVGGPVTLSITNNLPQTIFMASGCYFTVLRYGTPSGTAVQPVPNCPAFLPPIQPGQTVTVPWALSAADPAGTYWFQLDWYQGPGFAGPTRTFACFNAQAASAPTLAAQTRARVGQDLVMAVAAPTTPGAGYVTAASLTTDAGFSIPPALYCCLDLDLVFFLSFPAPDPILFAAFQGNLDASGTASGITTHIPNLPALVGVPLHFQAAVVPAAGSVSLTNAVNVCVGP